MSATAPIPRSLDDAYAAARSICREHARSFYFASHFLPRPKRDHAYAVYAFCRLLDDAADESESPVAVDRFVQLLDDAFGSMSIPLMPEQPRHERDAHATTEALALRAFEHTICACEIPKNYFLELAVGCRMDFTTTRYETWTELEAYCYRVAGVVGLIMCHVFGLRDRRAQARAVAMGNAMQLTNILRDVREDLDRGRVYLPREDLARFGVTDAELQTRRTTPAMAALIAFELERARALYVEGAKGLSSLPNDGSRLTASVMSVVYAGILGAIESHCFDVFAGRARLSTLEKLARLPAAVRLSKVDVGDEIPDVF
jgi:15-cis-phytoene synthase